MNRTLWLVPALAVAVLSLLSPSARADEVFYYTTLSGTIQKVDVTTGTNVAVVGGLNGGPDGLIFSDPNTLVFTEAVIATQQGRGQLQSVPVTGSPVTTLISSGLLGPMDLALDPSRTTVLVSDTGNSRLLRESLSGGSPTTLATFGSLEPTGVAYDASGHLFVVVGSAFVSTIEQLNPTTGAVIRSLGLPTGGNDVAYDPFSKALWVASDGGVIKVDTGLTTATFFSCLNPPECGQFDGLVSGGNGNIYLANGIGFIDAYNITGNTFSSVVPALGIDDLAPVIGSGSPTPTPEPGTFITLGTGLLGVWGVVRRKLAT